MKRKVHFFIVLFLNFGFAMAVSLLPLKVGDVLDEITTLSSKETQVNKDNLKY